MNYLQALADKIKAEVAPEHLPDEDADRLFLSYAVLLRAKGEEVSSQDVHDAWVAWMITIDPDHESLVPYADLPEATRKEDSPFVAAIRTVARSSD